MPSITLDHVTKRFPDGTVAVRDADFTVEDGEFFILVGPSGCGKSTLLSMIAGLETVTEGEIRVDGRRVNELDPRHRNMAMVFQSYAIYPHMSVRENLAFPLTLARMASDEIAGRVERAAEILGLRDLLDRRPAALSGGQRQRVAMGRAIVREPDAFLLDEPLSNLDARLRVQMRTEIARLQKRLGTTTVYVTHDQTEAMTLGDRVAVLRDGELQQIGSPRELYRRPRNLFVAGFIGSPGMNLLPAELQDDRLLLPMAELPVPEPLREAVRGHGGPLIAGIRPEDLQDAALAGEDAPGPRFEARVDVLEWMGAELYLYLPLDEGAARRLAELTGARAQDSPDALTVVARVDAASEAAEDARIALVLDPARLQLFDPATGERLQGDREDD